MKWLELLPQMPTRTQRMSAEEIAYWQAVGRRIMRQPVSRAVYAQERYRRAA